MRAFIQSPYLWSPKLKHLQLSDFAGPEDSASSLDLASLLHTLDTANVKLETFDFGSPSTMSLDLFSSSSCFSQLQSFGLDFFTLSPSSQTAARDPSAKDWSGALQRFAQSPNLSNLTRFTIPPLHDHKWTRQQLVSLLTSPMLSNNLVELDCSHLNTLIKYDLMETILTARVIPGDETSPLKFGKLQKLNLNETKLGRRTIELIVQNLPELTHLNLSHCSNITDAAITALIGDEHNDLKYPYPALPNLTHLDLSYCSVTEEGLIELSKSQLLDQLESFACRNVVSSNAFLKPRLFSSMKLLGLAGMDPSFADTEDWSHLDNCRFFWC